MISLNIPDSPLVPILVILNLDLASLLINLSRLQLNFLVKLLSALESKSETQSHNESFCAKNFEKFEFSDVTSDRNDEEESETKNFMVTMGSTISQVNVNFYSGHHRLRLGVANLGINVSDHRTHTQVKVSIPVYYIETDGERLLTSDGRGNLALISSGPKDTSRNRETNDKGLELVYTRAETKHWRKQENLSFEKDIKLSRYIEEFSITSGPVDVIFDLELLDPFLVFLRPFINRSKPSRPVKTTKLPLFNIDLAETCIFLPYKKGKTETQSDTCCLTIDRLVLTPRPNNPLERLVVIESIYELANEAGLLKSAGSPLEDTQFELELLGLTFATAVWKRQLAQRWSSTDSGILTGQNPALEWNRQNSQTQISGNIDPLRPILIPIDVRATWAPALLYKSKPIVASSLEVSLNRDLSLYVALPQVKLIYSWANSLIQTGQKLFSDPASPRRRRTMSESTRTKTAQYEYLLKNYPFEFILTGGGNISGMFYDHQIDQNGSHVIEPFLQFTFEQPSTTLTVTESEKVKLKLLCYDLCIKSYENHDSPLIEQKPFLPTSDHFNVVWLETKYNEFEPKPFITLSVTEEHTEVKVERPLKVSLDLAKMKIGAKFMKKLTQELTFKDLPSSKSGFETSGDEYFDIIRSVLHQVRLETSQIVVFVQLYKSAIQFSLEAAHAKCILEEQISMDAKFKGIRLQLKRNFSKFETVLGPWSGEIASKFELVAHSNSTRANVLKPKVFISLSSESLILSASSQLLDKLDCLVCDLKDVIPQKSVKQNPIRHSSVTTKNDLHKGIFEFISTPSETGPKVNQVLFETLNKSQLTWRYPERRFISRISVNPVPINRINNSGWPTSVQIDLQFYDEVLDQYITLKSFFVSETEPVLIDFSSVEHPSVSDRWRLQIPLYSTGIQPLSPFALAGCCRIDSTVYAKCVSTFSAQFCIRNIAMRLDNDLELKLSDLTLSTEAWNHLIKTQAKTFAKIKVRDHKTLNFVPIMSKTLLVAAVNVEPKKLTEFEIVLENCRLTFGQRIIHSLSQIVTKHGKKSFYQLVNKTPYNLEIRQPAVRRTQKAPRFETSDVYLIANEISIKSGSTLINFAPGASSAKTVDGINVECVGRKISVYGDYKLENLTPFRLLVASEHAQIELCHKEEKTLVQAIESVSVAIVGFANTRSIIIEPKTHTALELEYSGGNANIGMSVIAGVKENIVIVFSPLFIFRSYFPLPKELVFERNQSPITLEGKGKEHVVYSLEPHLTHQVIFDKSTNISVNLAVISDLIKSPEQVDDVLGDENHESEWPLCENDNFQSVQSFMNVRYQPKWGHLPTILVEFLPSMLWINDTGLSLFLSNETEAQVIEPNDSIPTAQWLNFKLDAKGRGTMLTADKEFEILDSTSPAWIHSPTYQVPLNGQLSVDVCDGETKVSISIFSILSRGIRQIVFTSPVQVVNRTKRPVKLTYGSFSGTVESRLALPVTENENIYFNDHRLPYDKSFSCFFVPMSISPAEPSEWLTVIRDKDILFIDEMTTKNPPRYVIHNQTSLILSIEEQSIITEIRPSSTIYYESYQEMAIYPGVNQKPVKVRLCSEDGAGILHLTPGQWGVKLCQEKLTVTIDELGRNRKITISQGASLPKSEHEKIEGSFKISRMELVLHDDTVRRKPVLGLVLLEPYLSVYTEMNDFVVNFGTQNLEISNLYHGKRFEYDTCLKIHTKSEIGLNSNLQAYSDEVVLKSPLSVRLKLKRSDTWLRHVEIRCPNASFWVEDTFLLVFADLLKSYLESVVLPKPSNGKPAAYSPIYIEYFKIYELNISG